MLVFVSLLLLYMCFKLKIACSQQSNASTECYLLFLDGSLMRYSFPTCLCWAQLHRRLAHEQASPPSMELWADHHSPVWFGSSCTGCNHAVLWGAGYWREALKTLRWEQPYDFDNSQRFKKKRFKKKKKKQAHLPAFRKKITAHKRFFFFSVAASFLLWG